MAKLLKKKKTELEKVIAENTSAVITSGKEVKKVIQEGTPLEHAKMHNINKQSSRTVGVNVGSTINMGDFQSLRIDCWITDELSDEETHVQGLQRITDIATEHLNYMADELANQ